MRLTRPGAVIIAILVGCAVVLVVSNGPARFVAALVGLLLLLVLASEGVGSGHDSDAKRKQEVLTGKARPRAGPIADEPEQPAPGLVSRRRRDPG